MFVYKVIISKHILLAGILLLIASCANETNHTNESQSVSQQKVEVVEQSNIGKIDENLERVKAQKKNEAINAIQGTWPGFYLPLDYSSFLIDGDKITYINDIENTTTVCSLVIDNDDYHLNDDKYYFHTSSCIGNDKEYLEGKRQSLYVELKNGVLKSFIFNQVEEDVAQHEQTKSDNARQQSLNHGNMMKNGYGGIIVEDNNGHGFVMSECLRDTTVVPTILTYDRAVALSKLYSAGGFHDWYLPTKDELKLICQHNFVLSDNNTAFTTCGNYISSSPADDGSYWAVTLPIGCEEKLMSKKYAGYALAVRRF